jgi:uncharacterized protein (DUF1778 family)
MSDILTLKVTKREKDRWRKAAHDAGEELGEFTREAARQRVRVIQARQRSAWDVLLGSVRTDMPPATNRNVRKMMRSRS